jgi:hypothetical protein
MQLPLVNFIPGIGTDSYPFGEYDRDRSYRKTEKEKKW